MPLPTVQYSSADVQLWPGSCYDAIRFTVPSQNGAGRARSFGLGIARASLAGGCTFLCDPSEDYALAAPIWSAAMDPHVLCTRARPCDAGAPLALQIGEYAHALAISDAGEHVLLRTSDTSLRLDVISGTVLGGPVMLEPSIALERLAYQISSIGKLDAMLRNVRPPPRDNDPRLSRLVLALRALDGRAGGASLRDLAFGLFGIKDWPGDGDHIKSRVRRLVKFAEDLRRAGPGGVLAHQI